MRFHLADRGATLRLCRERTMCIRHALEAFAIACVVMASSLSSAFAQWVEEAPLNLYGSAGLIDMPSARFMSDGTFAFTAETKQPDDRLTIAFQVTPWLEGTARYSIIYKGVKRGNDLYDRSLGFKLRLVPEGRYRPQVAVGALDIGGTLVYSGEYIVMSKQTRAFDWTLGLGFGRLGTAGNFDNPIGLVFNSFDSRKQLGNQTGRFGIKQWFKGEDVAIFGGVVGNTPIRGLQVIAEVSGDHYRREEDLGIYKIRTPINLGLSYRPKSYLELGAAWLHGRELALRLTMRPNLKNPPRTAKLDPPARPIRVRTEEEMREATAQLMNLDTTPDPDAPAAAWQANLPSSPPISNGPELAVQQISYGDATPAQGKTSQVSVLTESVEAHLKELKVSLVGTRIDQRSAVFEVEPGAVRPPLQCEELWPGIPSESIAGLDQVIFIDISQARAVDRCVKFLQPSAAATTDERLDANPILRPSEGLSAGAMASAPAGEGETGAAEPAPAGPATRSWARDPEARRIVAERIRKALADQRLGLEGVEIMPTEVRVYLANGRYQESGFAIGRAARALTHVLPPSVEQITLVTATPSVNVTEVSIPRQALERAARTSGSAEEIRVATTFRPAEPGISRDALEVPRKPRFFPIFRPAFRHSLFDPDDPMRYQIFWRTGGTIGLTRNLYLQGSYALDLYNNFDEISRETDSVLPHVRSDFANYLKEGESGIESLQVTWVQQLAPEWFYRLNAGIFEEAYGGVSGEVLYRPFASRWAFGAEISQVWKRAYDRGFEFQDYNVVTGHLSAYFESPWYDLDFAVHAGRYLAKDWGATFEISRRFANGAEVGAFATFTDVPFDTFGEGSFDKGIVFRIPLDFFFLYSTQQYFEASLRPLTRDGGQRVVMSPRLYGMTRGLSYGDIDSSWDTFLDTR